MKFTCLQENLAKALGVVTRTIPAKTPLPILANVLISTDNGRIRLAATDLATTIVTHTGASVDKEGALTVPAKILKDYISNISPTTLALNVLNDVLHITSENTKSKLNGIPSKDFPELPEIKVTEDFVEIDPKDFAQAVAIVAFASGTDESRPIFTGVLLTYKDNKLVLASTDGYRLAEKAISVKGGKEAFTTVIPSKTLAEVARIFAGGEEPIKVGLNTTENQLVFASGDTLIATRVLDGQYPDYKRIIPTESILKAVFDTEEFLNAVKLTNVFSKENSTPIKLVFEADKGIKIAALSGETGEHESQIAADIEGDLLEAAFNSKYLLDFLSNVKTSKVTFTSNGSATAAKLIPSDHEDYLHIIMPVQI